MNTKTSVEVTRRTVLTGGAGCALGAVLAPDSLAMHIAAAQTTQNVYELLGVKPVINAAGTLTSLGGSLMPPEVVEAWTQASRHFVRLLDLQDKIGERIAKLLAVEAAMVTTGAAGAMQLATAAALTRGETDLIARLPNTEGMKNEVITQKSHHACYDHQIANCGVRLMDVETVEDLQQAIGPRTAMMLFYNLFEPDGRINRREWIDVAQRHNVPTLLDAAADVPPLEALTKYCDMGFDMVAFSGGKALLGPNDTGLLLGRKQWIEAAKLNTAPRCGTIGRMMKVSKENMVAMWAAVERYVRTDHEAEWREWERRLGTIEKAVADIPTLKCERFVPPIANHVPHVILTWDEGRVRITQDEVTEKLAAGNPPIALGRVRGTGDEGLLISVFMLKPGEDEVVADALRRTLKGAVS